MGKPAEKIRITISSPGHDVETVEYYEGGEWKPAETGDKPHGPPEDVNNVNLNITRYVEASPAWCKIRVGGRTFWVPC